MQGRHLRVLALISCIGLAALALPAGADPMFAPGRLGRAVDPREPHAPLLVVAKLYEGVDPGRAVPGARLIFDRWYEVPVASDETPMQAVRRLIRTPGVELAELNYVVRAWPTKSVKLRPVGPHAMSTPNDPYYPAQWHFPQVQASTAWDVSTGAGVTVAVLDTGASQGGEDLDCHTFVSPFNAITDTAGAAVDDNGHGTHVSGTIAQCTNNGLGVAGLGYGAQLMPIKVTNAAGNATTADVAQGIDWARTSGARVINMSLGTDCSATWPACSASIENDAIALAVAADIVIAASSGNSNDPYVAFPANHPDVIAVGATRFDRARASYSSYGAALDLMAPGGDYLDQNGDGYLDGVLQETFDGPTWGYYFIVGTSMASPHVAAAAAILRSKYPSATRLQVMDALYQSALDLGAPGYDTTFGYGLIQIRAALDYLATAPTPSPTPSPSPSPTPSPSPGACTITGTAEDELLEGGPGDDVICGLGGDDELVGGGGNDVIDGGEGFDWVVYEDAPSAVDVNLSAGTASGGGGADTLISIEGAVGSRFNDSLTGDSGFNDLWGLGGSDSIDGAGGFDYVRYDLASKVKVDLATGIAKGEGADSLANIEGVVGSDGSDVLQGSDAKNWIYGLKGNDEMAGLGGGDHLFGGPGVDFLDGGRGNDRLDGGPGRDECVQGPGHGTSKSC